MLLFLAETKIDETFTDTQFKVNDFHFWHADRNQYGGGLVAYARSDLACDRKMNLEYQTIESILTSFKLGDAPFVKHVGSTTIFVRSNISQTSFKAVHFSFTNIS
jgi:hypothetical protein